MSMKNTEYEDILYSQIAEQPYNQMIDIFVQV